MTDELDRLAFTAANRIVNPAPERGMFSSIQCAAQWPGWERRITHWIITLGDQPHLREATLQALVHSGCSEPRRICQLAYQHRPRHPVWLPQSAFEQLAQTAEGTLKQFLQKASPGVLCVEYNDPGLEVDIDRPEDYRKAVVFFSHRHERTVAN
jgi:CTP:molybdopterin cytidylyltransferase MocA